MLPADSEGLFAHLEVDDFAAFRAHMAASPGDDRWQAEMAALIDPMTDPATGFHRRLEEIFHLDRAGAAMRREQALLDGLVTVAAATEFTADRGGAVYGRPGGDRLGESDGTGPDSETVVAAADPAPSSASTPR